MRGWHSHECGGSNPPFRTSLRSSSACSSLESATAGQARVRRRLSRRSNGRKASRRTVAKADPISRQGSYGSVRTEPSLCTRTFRWHSGAACANPVSWKSCPRRRRATDLRPVFAGNTETGVLLSHIANRSRGDWQLLGDGEGIHWPVADEDLSVAGLLAGSRSAGTNP